MWIISGFPLSLSALWLTVPQRDSDHSGAHHTSRRRCIFIAPATAAARPPDLSLVSPQTNGDAQDLHPARMHFKPVSLDYSQWILMHSLRVYQNQGPAIKGAAPNLFFFLSLFFPPIPTATSDQRHLGSERGCGWQHWDSGRTHTSRPALFAQHNPSGDGKTGGGGGGRRGGGMRKKRREEEGRGGESKRRGGKRRGGKRRGEDEER